MATAVLLDAQVIARPVKTLAFASSVVAVACEVSTALIEPAESTTSTVATGADVTVRTALPTWPSLVAVMLAVPGATAVTTPLDAETMATAALSEVQVIVRPVRILPLESTRVAVA